MWKPGLMAGSSNPSTLDDWRRFLLVPRTTASGTKSFIRLVTGREAVGSDAARSPSGNDSQASPAGVRIGGRSKNQTRERIAAPVNRPELVEHVSRARRGPLDPFPALGT